MRWIRQAALYAWQAAQLLDVMHRRRRSNGRYAKHSCSGPTSTISRHRRCWVGVTWRCSKKRFGSDFNIAREIHRARTRRRLRRFATRHGISGGSHFRYAAPRRRWRRTRPDTNFSAASSRRTRWSRRGSSTAWQKYNIWRPQRELRRFAARNWPEFAWSRSLRSATLAYGNRYRNWPRKLSIRSLT